jgi:hypothetical protein
MPRVSDPERADQWATQLTSPGPSDARRRAYARVVHEGDAGGSPIPT